MATAPCTRQSRGDCPFVRGPGGHPGPVTSGGVGVSQILLWSDLGGWAEVTGPPGRGAQRLRQGRNSYTGNAGYLADLLAQFVADAHPCCTFNRCATCSCSAATSRRKWSFWAAVAWMRCVTFSSRMVTASTWACVAVTVWGVGVPDR